MAIDKQIFRQLRIVPLRFTRCPDPSNPDVESGPARVDAPEVDDRGYAVAPFAAIMPVARDSAAGVGDIAHVKVIRQNIEDAAPLHVDSSAPGIVEVLSPAAGAALPNRRNNVIRMQAHAAGTARIRVRLGPGTSAPILGELEVRVNNIIMVDCRAHRTSINAAGGGAPDPARIPLVGGSPDFSAADRILADANILWRPYAIQFRFISRVQTAITDTDASAVPGVLRRVVAAGGSVDFPTFTPLMTTNRLNHAINVHFVRQIGNGNTRGLAQSSVTAATTYGLVLPDNGDANDLAHELGHVLDLIPGPSAHADDDPNVNNKRSDIWTTRRLMHSFNPFAPAAAHMQDVGYGVAGAGRGNRGALVSIKDLGSDVTDNELAVARATATPPLP